MTTMTVMPRESRDWTVDDLDLLPDDGLQYELLDGLLLVTPAPIPVHQRAIGRLLVLLYAACPPGFEAFVAPLDWRPDPRTSLQPDVLVVAKDRIGPKNITEPLALAVEVLSPSTRRKDMVLKRSKYEDAGVASYWIVDPVVPSFVAYDLVAGSYVEVARANGSDAAEVTLPFPVSGVPSTLV
jgi:Uma2 family endonuclease